MNKLVQDLNFAVRVLRRTPREPERALKFLLRIGECRNHQMVRMVDARIRPSRLNTGTT